MALDASGDISRDVHAALKRHWGFDSLRPLQMDSIRATLSGRDTLTVLPTGGGKSLCYQLPPLVSGRLAVVVSPLISLMEDQVAGMTLAGIPAAAMHSNLKREDAAAARELAASGELRVLLIAPERLMIPDVMAWIVKLNPSAIAIDEAHCISQWGHDFRPEYRRLSELRESLPRVPMGAYTATATPQVRSDIAAQLRLRDPVTLVGTFDRPNLTYRVIPRDDLSGQVIEALERHKDRAAIVYCLTRKDTEELAASLVRKKINAKPYHAGLDGAKRAKVSREFRDDRLNVVCATVAFGMGIDRGDVRCVIHAAMPKSIEHYQQETGRAGRDGLPAECLLLHSAADLVRWQRIMALSAEETGASAQVIRAQHQLLDRMHRFAMATRCRHASLTEYFGQTYEFPAGVEGAGGGKGCGACDVCMHELVAIVDAQDTARKIISCVARVQQMFGAGHVADVLVGANNAKVRERGHESLSTHGLLKHLPKERVVGYINQLIDAEHLSRSEGQYPVVILTETSAKVLRNELAVRLVEPKIPMQDDGGTSVGLSAGERALFESLRVLRRAMADERGVPPYLILGDAVLEEIAKRRPSSLELLRQVRGIGAKKAEDFGERVVRNVASFCREHKLELDVREAKSGKPAQRSSERTAPVRSRQSVQASQFFRDSRTIDDVVSITGRSRSTVMDYLADYVACDRPGSIAIWVPDERRREIAAAIGVVGGERLRPIFEHLGGRISYDEIRLVVAHLRVHARPVGVRA